MRSKFCHDCLRLICNCLCVVLYIVLSWIRNLFQNKFYNLNSLTQHHGDIVVHVGNVTVKRKLSETVGGSEDVSV